MAIHGINSVRGGSFSQPVLDDASRQIVIHQMRHADNRCSCCGREGHFQRDCPERGRQGAVPDRDDEGDHRAGRRVCRRCGRTNHDENSCHVTMDVDRNLIVCRRCGCTNHDEDSQDSCYATMDVDGNLVDPEDSLSGSPCSPTGKRPPPWKWSIGMGQSTTGGGIATRRTEPGTTIQIVPSAIRSTSSLHGFSGTTLDRNKSPLQFGF